MTSTTNNETTDLEAYTVASIEEGDHDPMTFEAVDHEDAAEMWAEAFGKGRFLDFAKDEGYEADEMGNFQWGVEVWKGTAEGRPKDRCAIVSCTLYPLM